jgi:hypothetical protein
MDVLGVLAMIVFCACVITLAAGVTWLVVKYSPQKKPDQAAQTT